MLVSTDTSLDADRTVVEGRQASVQEPSSMESLKHVDRGDVPNVS